MEVKTIKGISEEKWIKLKILSAKNKMPMGKLVENMIDAYEDHLEETWNKILYSGKILSDKEAEEIHKITKKIRKESWVRNANIELERENKYFIAKLEELKKQYRSLPKISFITYFEILEGIENKSEKNKEKAKSFIEIFEVLQTTKITAEKLVYLRKNYELPIPDLIIAAQTLENNGTLITKDNDFEQIQEMNKIILN